VLSSFIDGTFSKSFTSANDGIVLTLQIDIYNYKYIGLHQTKA